MRGITILAVLIALAIAAYLYQQNLQTTSQQLGAGSPKDLKPQLERLGQGIELQTELGARRVDEATR